MKIRSRVLVVLLLGICSMIYANWEPLNVFEHQFLPKQPLRMDTVTSLAVYSSLALPALPILSGDRPLYDAALYGTTLGISFAAKEALKAAARRPRPDGDASSWSFPSGHVTAAAASFGFLLYMNSSRESFHGAYLYASIPLLGTASAGRILIKRHYPTDVLAGFILGASLGYLVPMAADALF